MEKKSILQVLQDINRDEKFYNLLLISLKSVEKQAQGEFVYLGLDWGFYIGEKKMKKYFDFHPQGAVVRVDSNTMPTDNEEFKTYFLKNSISNPRDKRVYANEKKVQDLNDGYAEIRKYMGVETEESKEGILSLDEQSRKGRPKKTE